MKKTMITLGLAATGLLALGGQAQASTLEDVRDAGQLRCGVSNGLPGFSQPDSDGTWTGLDVDTCRAVAAAAPRARQAATGIPAEAIITRTMHLPAGLDEAALRARVQLDIEDSVKQPAGDIAYDFRPLDEAPRQDQQALLLVATRREEDSPRAAGA